MRHSKILWLFLILALACACGTAVLVFILPLFQTPRIVSIEPADGARDILPTSPITITFSAPMHAVETENNIRFQPRVNANFAWQDHQTLVVTPRTTLPLSKTITVQISTNAQSQFGRALPENFQTRFTTLAYPHVVAAAPALDAQFVYVPTRVTLTFNRALNPDRVRANFVITPTLANAAWRVDGAQVALDGFFQPRTRYQIHLARDARDAAYDLPLERDLLWSFTTAMQYPNFSIVNRGRVLDFSASEKILVPIQFTNVSRLDLAVYPITQREFDANADAPFETWYTFQPTVAPVHRQRVTTNAPLDQYRQQVISLPPLPAGTYSLRITTPEGPTDAQLVRVE
jgi:methionine-rich copper-binding protein CopC